GIFCFRRLPGSLVTFDKTSQSRKPCSGSVCTRWRFGERRAACAATSMGASSSWSLQRSSRPLRALSGEHRDRVSDARSILVNPLDFRRLGLGGSTGQAATVALHDNSSSTAGRCVRILVLSPYICEEMTALYVCYQSIREPLTHTQVVAYLKGLARVGHQILLLTFEPEAVPSKAEASIRQDLLRLGIEWRWLRYHKRPTLPATAFDALSGIVYGIALIRTHRIQLIHARSYVPGAIALALRYLTGVR